MNRLHKVVPGWSGNRNYYVFVYGTLKRGFRNHYNMQDRKIPYTGSGITTNRFALYMDPLQRNRPCMANIEGVGHRIRGEVYKLWEAQLVELDKFERVPTHYHRHLIRLRMDGKTMMERSVIWAYTYLININPNEMEKIKTGTEKVNLLADYTFDHHLLYVSRKELLDQHLMAIQGSDPTQESGTCSTEIKQLPPESVANRRPSIFTTRRGCSLARPALNNSLRFGDEDPENSELWSSGPVMDRADLPFDGESGARMVIKPRC